MTGLVRKAVLLAAIAVLAASTAMAGIPSPSKTTMEQCIMLLPGANDSYTSAGALTPYQPWDITVRDGGNNVIPSATVLLDFSGCPDLRLSDTQAVDPLLGQAGSVLVDCTNKFLQAVCGDGSSITSPSGGLQLIVRGAGRNSLIGGGIGAGGFDNVDVYADGQLMTSITATVPDENGAGTAGTVTNGIDAGDGAFFRFDLFNFSASPGGAGRSDFNCNDSVDGADGAIQRNFLFNDLSSQSPQATVYCAP